MFTDVCSIVNIIEQDKQFGNNVLSDPHLVRCREETEDTAISNNQGSINKRMRLYFLPSGTKVKNGDRIKTVSRRGADVSETEHIVDQVFNVGGFRPHHIEVTLK